MTSASHTWATLDCKPDAITILNGINDVQAVVAMGGRSRAAAGPDGLDPFRRNLEQIVTLVQSETGVPMVLLSIPPLAEDLDSTPNFIVRRYNKLIADLCIARHLTYLPLYERLSDIIRDNEHHKGQPSFPHPSGSLSTRAALRHYVLRQTWEQISRAYGFSVHTDEIHLNTQGAEAVAALVQEWLTGVYNGGRAQP